MGGRERRGPSGAAEATSEQATGQVDLRARGLQRRMSERRAKRDDGAALPEALRTRFETSLGADLSAVRLHTGSAAEQAADSVEARAFTTGNDIVFGAGQLDAGSRDGQRLIAHEVAHSVQQSRSGPSLQRKAKDGGDGGDASEQAADRAADHMVDGVSTKLADHPDTAVPMAVLRPGQYVISPSGAPAFDRHFAELMKLDHQLEREHGSLGSESRHVIQIIGGQQFIPTLVDEHEMAEVRDNTRPDTRRDAELLESAREELGDVRVDMDDLREQLRILSSRMDLAIARASQHQGRRAHSAKVEALQKKKEEAARAGHIAEQIGKLVASGEAGDVVEYLEMLIDLGEQWSLQGTEQELDKEEGVLNADEAANDRSEEQLVQRDWQRVGFQMVERTRSAKTKAETLDRRRQRAEGEYDAQTCGDLKFGPIAKREARAAAFVLRCEKFLDEWQQAERLKESLDLGPELARLPVFAGHSPEEMMLAVSMHQAGLRSYGEHLKNRRVDVQGWREAAQSEAEEIGRQHALGDKAMVEEQPKKKQR